MPESDFADRAGAEYWDRLWAESVIAPAVDPRDTRVRRHVEQRLHRWFQRAFAERDVRGARLVEIGCAHSSWLPYFARTFGFEVAGLDYSPQGVDDTQRALREQGIRADIVCADFRSPPEAFRATFDVLVSFGVFEHFQDTAGALRTATELVRPGGLVLTEIPNMVGVVGKLQDWWNHDVFDIHVPLDATALRRAHEYAGLEVLGCEYAVVLPFGVVNLNGLPPDAWATRLKKSLHFGLRALDLGLWLLDERVHPLPLNSTLAGFVLCTARRTA